jgi:hypothetical protein
MPAFAPKQDVNALVTKPWTTHGNVADTHAQSGLIPGRTLAVPTAAREVAQPTRPFNAHLAHIDDPSNNFPAACRRQTFFG